MIKQFTMLILIHRGPLLTFIWLKMAKFSPNGILAEYMYIIGKIPLIVCGAIW